MNGGYPGSLKCLSIILAAKLFGVKNYLVVASTPAKRSLKTFYDIILDLLIHFLLVFRMNLWPEAEILKLRNRKVANK